MFRIAFLAVTAFWVAALLFVLLNIGSVSAVPGFIILGATTFCMAVVAVLERLKKIEDLLAGESSTEKKKEQHLLSVGTQQPISAQDQFSSRIYEDK